MDTDTIGLAVRIAQALAGELAPADSASNPPLSYATGMDFLADDIQGTQVLIRTVTMIYTGHVHAVDAHTIVLDDAAWIADTGRFHDALTTGTLSEVEPYPGRVYVARSAVVDVTHWTHDLPRTQR